MRDDLHRLLALLAELDELLNVPADQLHDHQHVLYVLAEAWARVRMARLEMRDPNRN